MANSSPEQGFYVVNSGTGATSVFLQQGFICEEEIYLFGLKNNMAVLGELHSGTSNIRLLSNENLLVVIFGFLEFISKSSDLLLTPLDGYPNCKTVQDFVLKLFEEICRREFFRVSKLSNSHQNNIFHKIEGMIGAYKHTDHMVQTEITLKTGQILALRLPNASGLDVTLLSRLSVVLMPKYKEAEPKNYEILLGLTSKYISDLLASLGKPFFNLDDGGASNDPDALLTPFVLL